MQTRSILPQNIIQLKSRERKADNMKYFTRAKVILEVLKKQKANVCLTLTMEILLKVKKQNKKTQLLPLYYNFSVVNTAL